MKFRKVGDLLAQFSQELVKVPWGKIGYNNMQRMKIPTEESHGAWEREITIWQSFSSTYRHAVDNPSSVDFTSVCIIRLENGPDKIHAANDAVRGVTFAISVRLRC